MELSIWLIGFRKTFLNGTTKSSTHNRFHGIYFYLCFKLMLWEHFQIWLDDSRYNYRSIAHYKCDTGYQMFGPDQRTCTADGTWSDRGPQCQSIATNCHCRHSIITISMIFVVFQGFGALSPKLLSMDSWWARVGSMEIRSATPAVAVTVWLD